MQNEVSTPPGHVLFVDDDLDVLKAARLLFDRHAIRMSAAQNPAEAWSVLAAELVDVILLDLNFTRGATTGEEGFQHLGDILSQDRDAVVVVVTGHSGVNIAVAAMRSGASDFVMKPWSNERLITTVQTALELRRRRRQSAALKAENDALKTETWGEHAPLLGDSPAMHKIREVIRRAAPTNAPVLIYGPAGTGKSLIARTIHLQSSRSKGPFLPVDLGAHAAEEQERALFGDGFGAPGALLAANGGTLFLDDVSALTPLLQARLLDVLEQGRVEPVDQGRPMAFDARIVSSTRRRREALHGAGGLRDDLLYRLNTVEIFAPTLREREGDSLLLARHFLRYYAKRYGRIAKELSPEAADGVVQDAWPGDVRALRQTMERCVIFSEGKLYERSDFRFIDAAQEPAAAPQSELSLQHTERSMISAALKRNSFNVSHAAKQLGLSRAALYRRMAKHGL